jgi:hypothetical protein
MQLSVRLGLGAVTAVLVAGCGTEPLSRGLALRLDVQPAQVSVADTFTVRLVVRNTGVHDTTLTSACSVPTFFALDGAAGIVYPAPGFGCYTAITAFRIAAGDSLTWTQRFVARDIAQAGSPPLPPGLYEVFTDWQISGLPVLRQPLTVVDSVSP